MLTIIQAANADLAMKAWITMLLLDNDRFFVQGWNTGMVIVEHMREIILGSVLLLQLEPEGQRPGAH